MCIYIYIYIYIYTYYRYIYIYILILVGRLGTSYLRAGPQPAGRPCQARRLFSINYHCLYINSHYQLFSINY